MTVTQRKPEATEQERAAVPWRHRPPAPGTGVADAREALVLRVALAVAALAALDDAFGHPEPGVPLDARLAAGLVPAAVAGVLVWMAPRARAGLRGTVAVAAGVLALTAGIADGYRHALVDRIGGDDVTAMLAGLAGVVLIGLGAATLWRSRRRDGPLPRRILRRGLLTALAFLGALYVLVPVGVAIVATHRAREPVAAADLGRPYETVRFTTADGLELAGWYVPSRNGAAVIVSPGRRGPVAHARMLVRQGFGVLLFDRRGEGESDGAFNAFGWGGDADLKAAVGFLSRRPDVDPARIGGLGLSVGGEMLLEAAAEDDRLRAVVSEGASVRSLAEHWDDPGPADALRPFTPLVAQTAAVAVLSGEAPPPSLVDLVRRIPPRPVLLIRGLAGQPAEVLNRTFREAAGRAATLWEVPEAGHTAALQAVPEEYERRVAGFFGRALLGAALPDDRGGAG